VSCGWRGDLHEEGAALEVRPPTAARIRASPPPPRKSDTKIYLTCHTRWAGNSNSLTHDTQPRRRQPQYGADLFVVDGMPRRRRSVGNLDSPRVNQREPTDQSDVEKSPRCHSVLEGAQKHLWRASLFCEHTAPAMTAPFLRQESPDPGISGFYPASVPIHCGSVFRRRDSSKFAGL